MNWAVSMVLRKEEVHNLPGLSLVKKRHQILPTPFSRWIFSPVLFSQAHTPALHLRCPHPPGPTLPPRVYSMLQLQHLARLSGDAPVKNQWNYATLAPSRRCRRSSMFFGASSKSLPQPTWGVSWAAMGAETHVTNLWKYISHLDKMSLQPLEPHVPVSNRFENVPSWDPWDQALTQQPLETRPLRWGFLQFHRGIWGTYSLLHHSCRRSLSRSHRSPGTWRWTSTSILPSRDGNKMK